MARKIVICSGKGGVGKTTITANLGIALARLNQRVVLVDTDTGLNNLDVAMGIENKIVYDLTDILENRCRVRQALVEDDMYNNLYTLASCNGDNQRLTSASLKYILNSLSEHFDYILLDCPAGIEAGFHRAVGASDEAIIVTTPHIAAIRDADKVISILRTYQLDKTTLIINRVRGDLILNMEMLDIGDIVELLRVPLLGVIPENDDISTYSSMGVRLGANSNAAFAFDLMAQNLHSGTQKIYDCKYRFKGVLGKLRRSLKRMV